MELEFSESTCSSSVDDSFGLIVSIVTRGMPKVPVGDDDLLCAHGRSGLSSLCCGSLEHISMMHSRRCDKGRKKGKKAKISKSGGNETHLPKQ